MKNLKQSLAQLILTLDDNIEDYTMKGSAPMPTVHITQSVSNNAIVFTLTDGDTKEYILDKGQVRLLHTYLSTIV
jgi:hypothetical protein